MEEMTLRKCTEVEARAIGTASWMAVIFARLTIAKWAFVKRGSKNEMIDVTLMLKEVEDGIMRIMKQPPATEKCTGLDFQIDQFTRIIERLNKQLNKQLTP